MPRQTLANKKAVAVFVFLSLLVPLTSIASEKLSADVALIEKLAGAVESGEFFEAEKIVQSLSPELRKSNPQVMVLEALVEKGFYRTGAARSGLKRALRIDRNNGDALFEMALLLMEKRLWRRAEVLLRAASTSTQLSDSRRHALPYYLGVVAFESGRIFESRNHFIRLNWMDALDYAIRQSSSTYLSDIASKRPWSVATPVLLQHESNALGLPDGEPLPEEYSRRSVGKVVYGLFGNYSGVGAAETGKQTQGQASGPWGFSLRILASNAFDKQFENLNFIFSEAEANWTTHGQEKDVLKVGSLLNSVWVGGTVVTNAALFKLSYNQTDLSVGYELDAARDSITNRSVWVFGLSRVFELMQGDSVTVVHPVDLGVRVPVSREKLGEFRTDLTLAPGMNWYFTKRMSLNLSDQLTLSRVSGQSAQYNILKNGIGLKTSLAIQPYLTMNAGFDYETTMRTDRTALVRKAITTISFLGLF